MSATDPSHATAYASSWETSRLVTIGRYRSFKTGDILFNQRPGATEVALILAGLVKVTAMSGSGAGTFLAVSSAGNLVGEETIVLSNTCHTRDGLNLRKATAITDGKALLFPAEELQHFLDDHPDAMRGVAQGLCRRLVEAEARITAVSKDNADRRLACFLCKLWDLYRFEGAEKAYAPVRGSPLPRLTQQELAQAIGASRETVDRALRRWRERRIVSTSQRRIVILDIDTLARIAGLQLGIESDSPGLDPM